jgi:hypothetical protein
MHAFNHDSDQSEDVFAIQITKQTGDNQATNHYASEDNGGRGGDIEIRKTILINSQTQMMRDVIISTQQIIEY